jgi:hypothetical protein
MRLILVESPFKCRGARRFWSDGELNARYAQALCRFIAKGGDAPYASHMFCTQFLDDTVPDERSLGIEIGLAWGARAALTVVGVDRGISGGMVYGINRARNEGRPITWVSLTVHRDSWLPDSVDRAEWLDLFREGDGQVRDD